MAERVCYRLVARSPFHIGERGVGIEESSVVLHSDTLFSAICLTLRELGEDLEGFLACFPRIQADGKQPPVILPAQHAPPFRLSSAFPYAGDVFFFPRPMIPPQGLDEIGDPKLGKTLKKIDFVSRPIFEALLAGRPIAHFLVEDDAETPGGKCLRRGVLPQKGQVWVTPSEVGLLRQYLDARTGEVRLWSEDVVPRVTVDRKTNRSQVYAAGRIRFAPGCGLFLLIDYSDATWKPRVERALRVLGDSGIGGERSSGHGQFLLETAEGFSMEENSPNLETAYVTLSLFWPTEAEVQAKGLAGASYGLVNRHGWMGSPDGMNLRRRAVRMITEGSVLRRKPEGALADVKPLDPSPAENVPHAVWRYGLAMSVGCDWTGGNGGSYE